MKVVFLVASAWSHVNPSLPILCELGRRGVSVTYFAEERFRLAVEQTQATFRATPPSPEAVPWSPPHDASPGLVRALARRYTLIASLQTIPAVAEEVRREEPDVVVLDPTTGWQGLARSLNVPTATIIASFFYSADAPLICDGMPTDREKGSPALQTADARLEVVAEALESTYGVPRVDPDRLFVDHADLNLAATYRELQPDGFAFQRPRFLYLGAALDCRHEPEVPQIADLRPPTIYVSMGSADSVDDELLKTCTEAFADGVWSIAFAGVNEDDQRLSESALARVVLPQLRVLRIATVFLTHGGMNSVVESVTSGVPMLVLPKTPEQDFVASRIEELGLGIHLPRTGLSPARLRRAAEVLRRSERHAAALTEARALALRAEGHAEAASALIALPSSSRG